MAATHRPPGSESAPAQTTRRWPTSQGQDPALCVGAPRGLQPLATGVVSVADRRNPVAGETSADPQCHTALRQRECIFAGPNVCVVGEAVACDILGIPTAYAGVAEVRVTSSSITASRLIGQSRRQVLDLGPRAGVRASQTGRPDTALCRFVVERSCSVVLGKVGRGLAPPRPPQCSARRAAREARQRMEFHHVLSKMPRYTSNLD